jgi:probable rRNA maturation factor
MVLQIKPGLTAPDWRSSEEAVQALLDRFDRADAEVSVLLTDDPGIHALNRDWRKIDRPTDVLSWPQEDPDAPVPDSGARAIGDVAISLDTAARQAAARGWTISDEVALLMVHGVLHLLGYEDDSEAGSDEMKAIETDILGRPLDTIPGGAG